jgi:hypothetical protein
MKISNGEWNGPDRIWIRMRWQRDVMGIWISVLMVTFYCDER